MAETDGKRTVQQEEEIPDSTAGLTRSHEIAGHLTRRILDGRYSPGTRLPTERELAAEYETTRNVIREALKRMEAVGLVHVRRGSGAWVDNPRFSAGIELFDVLILRDDGSINVEFIRDAIEFRGYSFRLMVQLAAVRQTPEELDSIRNLVEERDKCGEDNARQAELTLAIFREIAYATHNQICMLMFNTVQRISMKLRELVDLRTMTFNESQEVFKRLVDAFERRDAALAELVVVRYIQHLEKAFSFSSGPSETLFLQ